MTSKIENIRQQNRQKAGRLGKMQAGIRLFDVTFNNPDFGLLVVEFDRQTSEFTHVSMSCKKLLGYDQGDMIGRKNYEFIHENDIKNTINESENQLLNNQESSGFINHIKKKNGDYVRAEWFSAGGNDFKQVAYAKIKKL